MALQCAFKISHLIIPNLQDKTFLYLASHSQYRISAAKGIPSDDFPKSPFPSEFIIILHVSAHLQLTLYWQVGKLQSSISTYKLTHRSQLQTAQLCVMLLTEMMHSCVLLTLSASQVAASTCLNTLGSSSPTHL